ncbi:hypothetical protein POKO110462_05055 [Pontibacter korlensis]|uniref:Uncharacterized protein n=1 Tax=Pontibacter korlensis TaxID=400092 RepID=A0A0E3UW62_9BACT|nr:hypothetical protein [Pontibacter korlensis]AKD03112.1 hypothetical protein PKOR_08245 [Pontibacter korlensis]
MPRPILKPQLRKKLLLIALICFLLASALELYTFGLHSDFPLRLLRTFFVIFVMVTLTIQVIVPGVNKGVDRVIRR